MYSHLILKKIEKITFSVTTVALKKNNMCLFKTLPKPVYNFTMYNFLLILFLLN